MFTEANIDKGTPATYSYRKGSELSLECVVPCVHPMPNFTWSISEGVMPPHETNEISEKSEECLSENYLTWISKITTQFDSSGTFTLICRVSNSLSSDEQPFVIEVGGNY